MSAQPLQIKSDSGQCALSGARHNVHARRKFYDIYESTDSPIARDALERIAALYQIEDQIRGKTPDERCTVRKARAGPLLDSLYQWLVETVRTLAKKSELSGAIRYALSRWTALARYRDDGRIEIDNTAAERALRSVALGRKYGQLEDMYLAVYAVRPEPCISRVERT